MLDHERILAKLDELDGYVRDLRTIKERKGFRNILVHEYGHVDDAIVYQVATTELGDFADFKKEVLEALKRV
ncbi:MAG: DUF86 domain-containing protein [Deltaproteobacteria bacterium]|nr:DUF86 domain-containing protein [Deltaproteobacteria bacterium]